MTDGNQKLLPFDEVTVEATSPPLPAITYEPSVEAREAYERLEVWLLDERGTPRTDLALETLRAVGKALLDGHRGWVLAAEDGLEALQLRNGRTEGDDIPPGPVPEGRDFQQALGDCLDELHEIMMAAGRMR